MPFFTLWAKSSFATKKQLDRAYWFLHEDTRPDFDDEVEESEQDAFEFIESIEDPDYLEKVGKQELIWELTVNKREWMPEEIIEGISLLGATHSDIFYQDEYDVRVYQHTPPKPVKTLYEVLNYDQEDEIRDELLENKLMKLDYGYDGLMYIIKKIESGYFNK
ncbi:hypothetical protein [Spartinivicinus poritis]|uniref:Uncharacterized protein n=1 Tax=Spartinivicinus poritis TaxID=2994640 RepID=A0ABT5U8J4_9GAMM|nr:hypothetical protein [Spartinivicinus sp. A2-2]MDE1462697.1 hypothetical protein [Spartinivicinus sp. A2-2]